MASYVKVCELSSTKKLVSIGGNLFAAFGCKNDLGPDEPTTRPGYFCPAEKIIAVFNGGSSQNNKFKFKTDREGGCYVETNDGRSIIYLSKNDIDIIKQEKEHSSAPKASEKLIEFEV